MKILCSKINKFLASISKLTERRRTTVLNDGTKITKPISYSLLYLALIVYVFYYFWNMIVTEFFSKFGFNFFINNLPNFFTILEDMVTTVNFSYTPYVIAPMIDTIQISVLGTLFGALLAIPASILASQNIMGKSVIPAITKTFLSIIRTFPTLVYAVVLSFVFDYGSFVGVLATILFTFGIISKMLYEIIESIDMGAFIAIETTGATKLQAFRAAVVPQVIGRFYSVTLYNFEINLRASAVLGFVNAGGIGRIMQDQMELNKFGNVAVMILALLVVVLVVENLSQVLRRRLT
ncbi:MAG: phosphonate ABC transporter, permease protein PhnE [Acholeplasmataceae bacterium]|nr:phosphonate ABC transporter, permease protein PhnE [Acholeplasmataceae bacterium]